MESKHRADICLILEGTYPFVPGGVSNWTHDLIAGLPHLSFHLLTVVAPKSDPTPCYTLPENVVGITRIVLQDLPEGNLSEREGRKLLARLQSPLLQLHSQANLADFKTLLETLAPYRGRVGRKALLDSPAAWELMLKMYEAEFPECSFIDYFWSWRTLLGGMYSTLLAELPQASLYHAVSTGYAGLLAARAAIETRRPALLTEHGIYTNERRIEISMSEWLYETPRTHLRINKEFKDLKDLWIHTFNTYSRICYGACEKILTLYPGNQKFQKADGADPDRLEIIPNGVDYENLTRIPRKRSSPPSIALIGRVVPIKDVKTFIEACALLKEKIPEIRAYIIGPTDEDKDYFRECRENVDFLGLGRTVTFTGRVQLDDYLSQIDVNVLTSISEGQPLVILEVGAVGIPTVATNVGACSELILGNELESPALGPGGAVTPLSNPGVTANAIAELLTDRDWYEECSANCKERVRIYYNKVDLIERYSTLYCDYLEDVPAGSLAEAGM